MMCTLTIKFLSLSKNPTRPSHPAWSCLPSLHPRSSVLARKRQNYTGTKTRKDRKIDSQFWNDKTSSPAAPRLRQFKRVQTNSVFGSGSKFIDRNCGEHISILSDKFWWEAWVRLPGERHNVGSINTLLGVTPISCREIDHLDSRNPLLETVCYVLCSCLLFWIWKMSCLILMMMMLIWCDAMFSQQETPDSSGPGTRQVVWPGPAFLCSVCHCFDLWFPRLRLVIRDKQTFWLNTRVLRQFMSCQSRPWPHISAPCPHNMWKVYLDYRLKDKRKNFKVS